MCLFYERLTDVHYYQAYAMFSVFFPPNLKITKSGTFKIVFAGHGSACL